MTTAAKKKNTRSLLIFSFGIVPAVGLIVFLFLKIGTLLVVNDPIPKQLDVIFTFGGENQRVFYSRKLMLQFPQAHWVLSDYGRLFSRILQRDGFTMTRVSFLDTCTNTLSEVNGLRDWLAIHKNVLAPEPKAVSIGLVSNPLHMRRIKFMIQTAFKNSDVTFYYLPVPLDQYHWRSEDIEFWWQSKTVRSWVSSELWKLTAFWFFS